MIHLRIESPGGRVRPACGEAGQPTTSPDLAKVTCQACKARGAELAAQLDAAVAAIRGNRRDELWS